MIRDYQLVSPSLEGFLSEAALTYEGLCRPVEIMRVMDRPAKSPGGKDGNPASQAGDRKILEEYFHDIYGVFMKNLAFFIVEAESSSEETVKLQAMLQEMIKVKRLMGN